MDRESMIVKVCGITRVEDALLAVEAGATAIGFVFWPRSPRTIEAERAAMIAARLPSPIDRVGVFVNESITRVREIAEHVGLTIVQLHGDEGPEYAEALARTTSRQIWRAVTLDVAPRAARDWPEETMFLCDASDPVRRGGTGQMVDWERAGLFARQARVVLAGGLTPENVADAVATVRPLGVDVSSGVEASPGIKDPEKVTRFVRCAREAFAREHARRRV